MKILVTGANGYLGQGIVRQLLDDGNEVIASDFSAENIDRRALTADLDLFAAENPFVYFQRPDVLLHLAWRDGFQHYSDAHIEDLYKHYSFIRKMCEAGIRRVAVMGSMHEIGHYEGCIDENTPCNPTTPYGIGKNALRELTELTAKKNSVCFQWLRGYYIVGNSEYGNSIFSKITAAEKRGEAEFPFTTGKNQYDFIDYTDFCRQAAAAVEQDQINGIINICSGRPERLADRVERFIRENNYNIRLKYGAFPDRPYDSKAVWGNNQKITSILENASK